MNKYIHEYITFNDKVAEAVKPAYKPEYEQRKKMLDSYKPETVEKVIKIASLFDPAGVTMDTVLKVVRENNFTEFSVFNRQCDQADGFKMKLVERMDKGKPVFTDDTSKASKFSGVYFDPTGSFVVRVFDGFVKSENKMKKQLTVELLNMQNVPLPITQKWVDENIMGLSSYSFKVTKDGLMPAGSFEQYGVDRTKVTEDEINKVMSMAHIPILEETHKRTFDETAHI